MRLIKTHTVYYRGLLAIKITTKEVERLRLVLCQHIQELYYFGFV